MTNKTSHTKRRAIRLNPSPTDIYVIGLNLAKVDQDITKRRNVIGLNLAKLDQYHTKVDKDINLEKVDQCLNKRINSDEYQQNSNMLI